MHTEHLNRNKVRLISYLSFVLGFLDGFLIYILSSYFSIVSGEQSVGVFYFIGYAVLLGVLFFLHPLIRKIGKARTLYLSLGLSILCCALLTRLPVSYVSAAILLVFIVATNLTWVAQDILLESFSKDQVSGRIRGLYLTIMSAGILGAPFLSTMTLARFDYSGVFFVLLVGYTVVFLVSLIGFRSDNAVPYRKPELFGALKKMLREKNLFRIYHISLAMEFFYAMMIVYTPLHLLSLGFSWKDIGIIFTFMLLPFVLLQYPLGILADKKLGEKELIIGSLAIVLVATATLPFLGGGILLPWIVFLFLTRVGIAGIEVLRDSYFYKQIDGDDMDIIAFFRTARPVANILAALIAVPLLLVLPFFAIFFIVALMLFSALITSFFLRDTISEQEILSKV